MQIVIPKTLVDIPTHISYAFMIIFLFLMIALLFALLKMYQYFRQYLGLKNITKDIHDQQIDLLTLEQEILDVGLFYHKMQPEHSIESDSLSYKKITKRIMKLIDQFTKWRKQQYSITTLQNNVIHIRSKLTLYSFSFLLILLCLSISFGQWTAIQNNYIVDNSIIVDNIPTLTVSAKTIDPKARSFMFDKKGARITATKEQLALKNKSHNFQLLLTNDTAKPIRQMAISPTQLTGKALTDLFKEQTNQIGALPHNKGTHKINITLANELPKAFSQDSFDKIQLLYIYYLNDTGELFQKEVLYTHLSPKANAENKVRAKDLQFTIEKKDSFGVLEGVTSCYLEDKWIATQDFDPLENFKK